MSDTPRTDGRVCSCLDMLEEDANHEYVDLSRTLERELNSSNARIKDLEQRIITMADESCGIDVRTTEEALTEIDKKMFEQRHRIEELENHYEVKP